jgi:hypothetical protein
MNSRGYFLSALLLIAGVLLSLLGVIACFVLGVSTIVAFATTEGATASQLVIGICEVVFCGAAALPGCVLIFWANFLVNR